MYARSAKVLLIVTTIECDACAKNALNLEQQESVSTTRISITVFNVVGAVRVSTRSLAAVALHARVPELVLHATTFKFAFLDPCVPIVIPKPTNTLESRN